MADIPAPQKPIPQFTIRWMLGLMTVWAVIFSIVALAMRGHYWALVLVVAVSTLALFMLVGSLLFSVIWIFAGWRSARNVPVVASQSPFREVKRPTSSEYLPEGE